MAAGFSGCGSVLTGPGGDDGISVPVISPAAGTYMESQIYITITAAAGDLIQYSIDGELDSFHYTDYSGPFLVSLNSGVDSMDFGVKARAVSSRRQFAEHHR